MNKKINLSLKSYITDLNWWREMSLITLGCVMCAIGFVFFIFGCTFGTEKTL